MTRMRRHETPQPVGSSVAEWLGPIDREMRALLADRERDPEWQRRQKLEDDAARKTELERWLTIIEGCARGNYGPKAKAVAEKAGGRDPQVCLRDAVIQIRRLWENGEAERSRTYEPVKRVTLSSQDFVDTNELQSWLERSAKPSDYAEDFDRSL